MAEAVSFLVPRARNHLTNQALRAALLEAMESVLFQPTPLDNVFLGPLEAEFARRMQRTHAFGVNSATAGLFLALAACGVGAGDEVITVGNSDISTTAAVSHCGALPVVCDVQESDYTIELDRVEELITTRTVALLPVDIYGYPADVRRLREIADRHGLKIVEDAALATGASDYGCPVGAFADMTVFSFGSHKPLASVGNGGMVVTNDASLAERLQLLRSYGRARTKVLEQVPLMEHVIEGYNLPLDPLEAAIVSVKLPLLEAWTARRREIAGIYQAGLQSLGVGLPRFRAGSCPTFHEYVVRVPERDRVYQALRAKGIEAVLHYWPPIHRQRVYANGGIRVSHVPVTDRLAAEFICLPSAPELTDSEIHYVIDTLRETL